MGAWGSGLYSSDFACDLRSTVGAVARLPLDGSRLLEIVRQTEPDAAGDPNSEDHTTFWLVAADQFVRRGIECAPAVEKALSIIDSGSDIAAMRDLGMTTPNLRKRSAKLSELRERLAQGIVARRRHTLAKPQRYTMEVGDVLAYPASRGQPINPYAADSKKLLRWEQDGWAAMLVVRNGRAFDYLAWYSIAVVKSEFPEKPTLGDLLEALWTLREAGTCSPVHFKRMELEPLGKVVLDRDAMVAALGMPADGSKTAIADISISNHMSVVCKNPSQPFIQKSVERLASVPLREIATPL
jgi:hypothetical protein